MFESILVFSTLVLSSWWFFIAAFFIILFLVHLERDFFSLVMIGLFIISTKILFGLTTETVLWSVFLYIPFGVGWALFRWDRFCADMITKIQGIEKVRKLTKDEIIERLSPTENKSKIVYWITIWPFSLLEHFLTDFIDMIFDSFKGVFTRISKKHIADMNKDYWL